MSDRGRALTEVARMLRQRREMGEGELFLDSLTRDDVLALVARQREGAEGGDRPRSSSAAGRAAASAAFPAAKQSDGSDAPSAETGASASLPVMPASYDELRTTALSCTRCRLSETRTQVVFSDGSPHARLVVVGEAPGANEDATGLPFVGAAGQFLDLLLATVDLSRKDSVYICNVLKCRPPGNRNPLPDEIESCVPYLTKQLELVAPRALLAVGTFAAQALTGEQKPLGRLRGTVHGYQGIPLVVTYHPAALLRNAGWTRSFWDDLQLLRQVMDGA
ncbi:MAG: uracil-DNA glycosylase [Gemmatimonadota bacterium]|jgi:DNA polymerase